MAAEKLLVCKGAECKCSLGTTPGILDVTSQNSKKLEGQLQATEGDKTFSTPFGACKRSSPNPPCTPQLQNWQNTTQNTKVQGQLALLEDSTNTCVHGGDISIVNPGQSTGKTADLPANEIRHTIKAEVHFRRKLATLSPHGTVNYNQNYAIYPEGFNEITQVQAYGFDWVRDVLDGEEDYLHKVPPREVRLFYSSSNYQFYWGKHIHVINVDTGKRKVLSEKFYFVIDRHEDGSVNPSIITPHSEIIEYNAGRSKTATHNGSSTGYTQIMGTLGGSYAALESTIITTSFTELAKIHSPVSQYINTPFGTERTGGNTANITLIVNEKNFYVPWLAVRQNEQVEIQALCFADQALPAGEIRFIPTDTVISVTPNFVDSGNIAVHPYPTATQTSDVVPASNKISLQLSFSSAITQNATLEARFFDDTRMSEADYKGELLGVLNILKNDPEYEMQPRFVKVYFTDDNNVMGNVLPLKLNSTNLATTTIHTANSQLVDAQQLMDLFKKLLGDQHYYLEKLFGQALIEYKTPTFLSDGNNNWNQLNSGQPVLDSHMKKVPNLDVIGVDISEFLPAGYVPAMTGNDFSGAYGYTGAMLSVLNSKISTMDGVTFFLLPFEIAGLFGQSDGIGGSAKTVLITRLMLNYIASDRATAGHEAAHSLNLYHSFEDSANSSTMTGRSLSDSPVIYVQKNTENVMDYTSTARTFYKWQWERMQNDAPDIVAKP